ncbi:TAXI family TRAP transporter solute-binding subunit [Prescottella agglutinans]|uniref:TRAP transporter TAXI family solute receptor n=1 Tax=Prescottella agglutinans TaxID=1644129 RepID=A0ABT6M4D8_9NOCA|nr:TAXI family TRAP transporter solute-binding subunit [Prescottella agglutinans]MDH6279167.1 TRAP transporter TAXI family solute receptor [Prescottella agglutinans]
MITRRSFLTMAGAGVLAVAGGCGSRTDPVRLRLASGEVGGLYHAFAELLAAAATGTDTVRIEPVATEGSRANLDLLARGEADLALTLADSVDTAAGPVLALGRVYENYLQLVVRAEDPIAAVADLRGRRVNLGALGSGAAYTGARLFEATGLDPDVDIAVTHLPLGDALAALHRGDVEALLWAGGVPTAALEVPARMRLLDLTGSVEPMRERFGRVYDRVTIPADAYPGGVAVGTIGVANLLLARPELPDALAAGVVDLLLFRAAELVPAAASGTQFLDGRSLISTAGVPLHAGAAAAYRRWHG